MTKKLKMSEVYTESLHLKLTPYQKDRIAEIAIKHGYNMTNFIRILINHEISKSEVENGN